MKFYIVGYLVFCSCIVFAGGEKNRDDSKILQLDNIHIYAPKENRDLLIFPSMESAGLEIATSVVDRKTIERQNPRNLSESINYATGVLTETRGRKVKQFSSFRGQQYPYPDYALNGIWQREFAELPYLYPASQIEKVEIVRSSGALLLGLADLSGVINIIPRRYSDSGSELELEYGRFNTFRGSVSHGFSNEKGYLTLVLNHSVTEGPKGRNGAERMNSLSLNGGYELVENLHLQLNFFFLQGEREILQAKSPAGGSLIARREQFNPVRAWSLSGKFLYTHNERASSELSFSYTDRRSYFERKDWKPTTSHDFDYEYGLNFMHAHKLSDSNTLRMGMRYHRWVAPQGKRFYSGQRADIQTVSAVVVDEHDFGNLKLDAGLRYTREYFTSYSGKSLNLNGASVAFADAIKDEWQKPVLSLALGAKYMLNNFVALYAHFTAGGVNAPKGGVDATGADNIKRENRYMVDAGISFTNKKFGSAKVGVFCIQRDDAIALVDTITIGGDDYNVYANRDMRQFGLELEYRSLQLLNHFELFAGATMMQSEYMQDGNYENVREVPDLIITGGIFTEVGAWDLNIFGKYVSQYENKRFAADKQFHDLADFTDINVCLGYNFSKGRSRLYLSVENILNDHYSTVVGYPDFGTQFFVGFRHKF